MGKGNSKISISKGGEKKTSNEKRTEQNSAVKEVMSRKRVEN